MAKCALKATSEWERQVARLPAAAGSAERPSRPSSWRRGGRQSCAQVLIADALVVVGGLLQSVDGGGLEKVWNVYLLDEVVKFVGG
eukprot:1057193-Pyramimonas_sp.AAC.1